MEEKTFAELSRQWQRNFTLFFDHSNGDLLIMNCGTHQEETWITRDAVPIPNTRFQRVGKRFDVSYAPTYGSPGYDDGHRYAMQTWPSTEVGAYQAHQAGMKSQEEITNFIYAAQAYFLKQQSLILDGYRLHREDLPPRAGPIIHFNTTPAEVGAIRDIRAHVPGASPYMAKCLYSTGAQSYVADGEDHDWCRTLWGVVVEDTKSQA